MYCHNCGKRLIEGAHFCGGCGAKVIQIANALDEQQTAQSTDTSVEVILHASPSTETVGSDDIKEDDGGVTVKMQDNSYQSTVRSDSVYAKRPHPYHNLGGWLAFIAYGQPIGAVLYIIIGITNIVGLFSMLRLFGVDISMSIFMLVIVNIAIYTIFAVFAFKFFFMVKRKDPKFFRLFENLLLFFLCLNILLSIVSPFLGLGDILGTVLSTAIVAIVWSLYFCKSVRVRTYFGTDEYLRCSRFLKNVTAPTPADM